MNTFSCYYIYTNWPEKYGSLTFDMVEDKSVCILAEFKATFLYLVEIMYVRIVSFSGW